VKENKSIGLLTCYIGKLPWYFDYFIHSCRYNPSVDFYLITDDTTYSRSLPNNVKLINNTLEEISALATQKLGFLISISTGYKLCDFKPAYGLIFEDILNGYDFWGHCDIDIIFGDIREFITDELLQNHDLISVRHDWLSGCFLLYKNTDKLNNLFLHSRDYKKVLTSDRHYCFDETNFAHDAFTDGKLWHEIGTEIESMTHVVKKLEADNYIKPFFDFFIIEGLPGRLKWENGRMFYRNKYEILFYHMIYFKKKYHPSNRCFNIPNSFTISPTRIHHKPKLTVATHEL
jgi:hypothetical protein